MRGGAGGVRPGGARRLLAPSCFGRPWGGAAVAVLVSGLGLLASSGRAQAAGKHCAAVEVRSLAVTTELETGPVPDAQPERIESAVSDGPLTNVIAAAIGPVLGPMDSEKLKTQLSCGPRGINLIVTISRSEHFNGAVLQNQTWRPRISMVLNPRAPEVVLAAKWEMRLTSGKLVKRAQTPPYSEREYPIVVTKTLRSAARLP